MLRFAKQTSNVRVQVTRWSGVSGILALIQCASGHAQSLSILSGDVHLNGIRPGVAQIQFNPGSAQVEGYHMRFSYPPELLATPVISLCAANAQCTVDAANHSVDVVRKHQGMGPLATERACLVEFLAAPGATPNFAQLSITQFGFSDAAGVPLAGTAGNGTVAVLPGESSPLWQYTPDVDPDCSADSTPEIDLAPPPGVSQASIAIETIGRSANARTVAISCGASNGFTLLSGGEQEVPGDQSPAPIVVGCNGTAVSLGTLICVEASSAGELAILWDLACAAALFSNGFE